VWRELPSKLGDRATVPKPEGFTCFRELPL
jgi:hypothetical protein